MKLNSTSLKFQNARCYMKVLLLYVIGLSRTIDSGGRDALGVLTAISNIKRSCFWRNTKEAISRLHITLTFHTKYSLLY